MDLRGKFFECGVVEGNFVFGFCYMYNNKVNFGVWVGVDV